MCLEKFFRYLVARSGNNWSGSRTHADPESDLNRDIKAFCDCSFVARSSSWFDWDAGSCLFFWRWPAPYIHHARDGIPTWFQDKPPRTKKPQSYEKDDNVRLNMAKKIRKVRERGYIQPGFVRSLIRFFAVPKGDTDIGMVYDGTSSGFNQAVWAPSFTLPTVESLLRAVGPGTWMGDIDIGEMFLNFPLHESAQMYCGVDLTTLFPEELSHENQNQKLWERWTRCLMGAKASPYQAIRAMLWAEDAMRGDRYDDKNPFRWEFLRLNLPGAPGYDPSSPWVAKVRSDGTLATEFFFYVDDVRITASGEEGVWEAIRRISSVSGYLGIQDAARKRRPPSTHAGAWAGSMVYSEGGYVGTYVDQAKWDKTKTHLQWIKTQIDECDVALNSKSTPKGINHKELERRRGFLVYVSMTYPAMVPYLKGIHQTLGSWRSNRDEDGWKLTLSEMRASKYSLNQMKFSYSTKDAPTEVYPVARLEDDINCLLKLFESPRPTIRHVRSTLVSVAMYGFGDASGSGFGSSIQYSLGLRVRHGIWGADAINKSSNFREFANLVETLEEEAAEGLLSGSELFLFTDNQVTESCYYRGTSSSRTLFNLVLRLRAVEMNSGMKLHVIHVAGTRMIDQGTDGLSRGNFLEGVMAGNEMTSFLPLHLTAMDRSPILENWIRSWAPSDTHVLKPDEWYTRGHGILGGGHNLDDLWMPTYERSTKMWVPPPEAAFEAIEELARARHMDPTVSHIFVCPRLMIYSWRKLLIKLSDLIFYVEAGSRPFWPKNMHEPLIVGIVLTFRNTCPWQLRRSEPILELERELLSVRHRAPGTELDILRKLWNL